MLTYNDFEKAQDKRQFVLNAITEYKCSETYLRAAASMRYFNGNNDILQRMKWFYNSTGAKQEDKFKTNERVVNQIYEKIILQENSYLLGNGITTDEEIKKELGNKFDFKLQKAGLKALVMGASFAYCYINSKGKFDITVFDRLESFALLDEYNGNIRALIRWWQLDDDKPLNIELYTETELILYTEINGVLEERARQPYIIKSKEDATGILESVNNNWSKIPITILYSPTKKPLLTAALKSKIDLYDIIFSDFGNNLEDSQDVYWILKNYQGQDIGEFLADYKYYKAIKVDDDGDARAETLEVPYQARQTALDILKKQIYEDTMSLDMSVISGGSLTNVAIKANMIDLDLKTDLFEWNVIDFCEDIISFLIEFNTSLTKDYEIKFIRRNIVNDTEIIDNIMKCRQDLSLKTALELNPYIDDVEKVLEEIETEDIFTIKETPEIVQYEATEAVENEQNKENESSAE